MGLKAYAVVNTSDTKQNFVLEGVKDYTQALECALEDLGWYLVEITDDKDT